MRAAGCRQMGARPILLLAAALTALALTAHTPRSHTALACGSGGMCVSDDTDTPPKPTINSVTCADSSDSAGKTVTSITVGKSVTCTADVPDVPGYDLTYTWTATGAGATPPDQTGHLSQFTTRLKEKADASIQVQVCAGSSNTSCTFSATVTVTASAIPPPTVTATCSADSVPAGSPVSCTADASADAQTLDWLAAGAGASPDSASGKQFTTTLNIPEQDAFISAQACSDNPSFPAKHDIDSCTLSNAIKVTVTTPPPPTVTSFGCDSATAFVGKPFTCVAVLTKDPASIDWSSTGAGTDDKSQKGGTKFTLQLLKTGTLSVFFQACAAPRISCVNKTATVMVVPPPPTISDFGCAKTSVVVGDSVTCTAKLSDDAVSIAWSANGAGADPPNQAGSTQFTTKLTRQGNATIGLTACSVANPQGDDLKNSCADSKGFTVTANAAPAPQTAQPAAGGTCSQWNVAGAWQLSQSNNYSPALNLQQNGTTISGSYTYSSDDQAKGNYVSSTATVTGTLVGNQIQFTTNQMAKKDGSAAQGQYSGTVSQGQISNGMAKDVLHPGSTATWSATGSAVCATGSGSAGR